MIEFLGLKITLGAHLKVTLRSDRWPRIHAVLRTVERMRAFNMLATSGLAVKAVEKLAGQLGAAAAVIPHASQHVFAIY